MEVTRQVVTEQPLTISEAHLQKRTAPDIDPSDKGKKAVGVEEVVVEDEEEEEEVAEPLVKKARTSEGTSSGCVDRFFLAGDAVPPHTDHFSATSWSPSRGI